MADDSNNKMWEQSADINKSCVGGSKLTDRSRIIVSMIVILLCVIVIASLCVYQYCRFAVYEKVDISSITPADVKDYLWDIETNAKCNGYCEIYGWIVKTGESINTRKIDLIIEKEDGTAYLVPTDMIERKDISDTLNKGISAFDYSASGFATAVNVRSIGQGSSRLYVLYRNNNNYELVDISEHLNRE